MPVLTAVRVSVTDDVVFVVIDGEMAINLVEHYVVGDAHTNSCENRHSFLRNWLRRFRGVSKHHLQGYLNFFSLTLNTDSWFEKILGTDFYR